MLSDREAHILLRSPDLHVRLQVKLVQWALDSPATTSLKAIEMLMAMEREPGKEYFVDVANEELETVEGFIRGWLDEFGIAE